MLIDIPALKQGAWTLNPAAPGLKTRPRAQLLRTRISLPWTERLVLMAASASARRLPMGVRTFSDFLHIATVGSPRACRTAVPRGCLRQNIRWACHGESGVYYCNDTQPALQYRVSFRSHGRVRRLPADFIRVVVFIFSNLYVSQQISLKPCWLMSQSSLFIINTDSSIFLSH